ncbi:hypothetical protein [Kushneria avicenniae]|nr:hypothetical protein [Kushneria avicenniae]
MAALFLYAMTAKKAWHLFDKKFLAEPRLNPIGTILKPLYQQNALPGQCWLFSPARAKNQKNPEKPQMWKSFAIKGWTLKKITIAVAMTAVTTAGTYHYSKVESWSFTPAAQASTGMCS